MKDTQIKNSKKNKLLQKIRYFKILIEFNLLKIKLKKINKQSNLGILIHKPIYKNIKN